MIPAWELALDAGILGMDAASWPGSFSKTQKNILVGCAVVAATAVVGIAWTNYSHKHADKIRAERAGAEPFTSR